MFKNYIINILNLLKRLNFFLKKNNFDAFNQKKNNSFEDLKKSIPEKNKTKFKKSFSFAKKSPQSYELQRKLALLVSSIDFIDKKDIRHLEYRKFGNSEEDDLLTSYRIDFNNKDQLEYFKKKYDEFLL